MIHLCPVTPASQVVRRTILVIACFAFCLGGCMNNTVPSGSRAQSSSIPKVSVRPFGTTSSGEPVDEYTLTSGAGLTTSILTWGGIIRTLLVPDRNGTAEDVVLGFDTLPPYEERHPWFGTITGRFANRIAKGRFTLDGKQYSLAVNNGPNHLHGGINGFDRAVWKARIEQIVTVRSACAVQASTRPETATNKKQAIAFGVLPTSARQ
jgi:hypothetical protein